MPIAMLYLLEGRDRETKERVIREVTGALERSLGSPPEKIRVILQEIPSESWGVGGVPLGKKELPERGEEQREG
ncbi:MAG TPA: 2-hydroxymuconate tautomerase family protein [Candidatus Aminicenantes bacterium]|nr:2-hydroxymuconate tautomerase family protein [Candidatus Aminicenantes bacterium]HPB54781.1 2-hydroxymuconate tautomerase family protein [Candidatus Aminicenantes bacterium]HPS99458.1 2-hydroxymuconate tautomerase family protein [Candidatus Aminicenantes bacterium]